MGVEVSSFSITLRNSSYCGMAMGNETHTAMDYHTVIGVLNNRVEDWVNEIKLS
jgi:hypothetical protein